MPKHAHGANLFELERLYHFSLDEIMDFSSNVNPLGPSQKALDQVAQNADKASVYPDPAYVDLKAEISAYCHARPDHILLGSGTTQLIKDYIQFIHPKKALINSPCYSEYENELKLVGAQVQEYKLDYRQNFRVDMDYLVDYINKEEIDLYVITNPNNPTGTILDRVDLERILKETQAHILIDETYIEFTDKAVYSAIPLASKYPQFLVVRSTSKFFSSPGIRLGYGVTSDGACLDQLQEKSTLWGINIFAEMMGRTMFSDEDYKAKTFNLIAREKEDMISALEALDEIKVFPSYANFVLCKIKKEGVQAAQLRQALLPQKMVIRDCASFKNLDGRFFRFCILAPEANRLLIRAIYDFFGKDYDR
ncbi:MAG: histidinol-phosphate transaminase [Tissierellia bacterium]|nr:histidinol-phosphate transaminase [Tissierellia bacterium]